MNPKKSIPLTFLAAAASPLLLATGAWAQHYPAGAEGIRAATLPPPGVYLRDYNFFYFSEDPRVFPLTDIAAYINAPRVIWMTHEKILGADYGMDLIVPFGYSELTYLKTAPLAAPQKVRDSRFGLHDIQVEPLLLSWHLDRFDIAGGYAVWAPTGDFDKTHVVNLGEGFWTHMLTAGATWYPDQEKTWALSVLNRYEINQKQDDTGITYGQTLTMEFGLSKSVWKSVQLGLVGYWQKQMTENSGPTASGSLSQVIALGPEISAVCPKLGVLTSVRYLREFGAKDRPEGNLVVLTLTKRL